MQSKITLEPHEIDAIETVWKLKCININCEICPCRADDGHCLKSELRDILREICNNAGVTVPQ